MPTKAVASSPLRPLFDLLHEVLVNLPEPHTYKVRSGEGAGAHEEPRWLARLESGVPALFPRSQSPRAIVYGAKWGTERSGRAIELANNEIRLRNTKTHPKNSVIKLAQLRASEGACDEHVRRAIELLVYGWNGSSKPSEQ